MIKPRFRLLAALPRFAAAFGLLMGGGGALSPVTAAPVTITVDPARQFQTIHGWEAVAWASQDDPAFPRFQDELFDRVIAEAGINRLRLEVRSGAENSRDYYADFQAGRIDYPTWRANRYATANDNADPNAIDPAGFHFTELDQTIERIVLPLRTRAAAKGEPLYINLNYVAFTSQITPGGSYHHADPEEYAEFILAVFQHLNQRFGFVPDAVEILLEPDNVAQWNGVTIGQAIVAVVNRLGAAGYHPEIIAPSCTNLGNAVRYFDALAGVPGAVAALDEIAYHRYGGVSDANLQALATRSVEHDKRTAMLEWWNTGNGIDVLLKDLTLGRNSAWQQGALAGVGAPDNRMVLYQVDTNHPAGPVVRVNRKTRLLRQVYRFVRRGAVRLEATSSDPAVPAVAFRNADGAQVVVARGQAAAALEVHGLAAGAYGINYSTATEFNVNLPHQTIAAGEALTVNLPAAGALTVYALRPRLRAGRIAPDGLSLEVRSLQPGFSGVVEQNPDPTHPLGWQPAVTTSPADFRATWATSLNLTSTFFRFSQP